MWKVLLTRFKQKFRTFGFPEHEPILPNKFRGLPKILTHCSSCKECEKNCPTKALSIEKGKHKIDLGKCLFCTNCSLSCSKGCISFTQDYRLSTRTKKDLYFTGDPLPLAQPLEKRLLQLFGRSLKLRQVSAGGCNGCELDTNVLNTLVFDLSRFGIQFVASPRHADGLLVTGPVTRNMELALKKTYAALPEPKIVIVVGACAISGGPYIDHPEVHNGVDTILPVDLYIPGCPPHPYTILDGLLRLLGKRENQ
ncbi:MAG: NADH-quinone oxidoreductase subunit NuoB [Chlamydiota bacterium]